MSLLLDLVEPPGQGGAAAPSPSVGLLLAGAGGNTGGFTATGGAVLAGSATVWRSRGLVGSGGLISGGASVYSRTRGVVAAGGLISGGAASASHIHAVLPSGGLVSGGAAVLSRARGLVATGGLVAGGASAFSRTRGVAGSGGLGLAGAATLSRSRGVAAQGGLQFGGVATLARTHGVVAAGGLQSGGSSTMARTRGLMATGGLTAAGTADPHGVPGGGGSTGSVVGSGGMVFGGEATITGVPGAVAPPTVGGGFAPRTTGRAIRRDKRGVLIADALPGCTRRVVASGGAVFGGEATFGHVDGTRATLEAQDRAAAAHFVAEMKQRAAVMAEANAIALELSRENEIQRAAHQRRVARDDDEFMNEL